MDKLFDEISRILASPIPRRRAMKLVTAGLVGAVLSVLGLERVAQAADCHSDEFRCDTTACCKTATQKCCGTPANTCCAKNVACCTGTRRCCSPGEACVSDKCKKQPPSPTQP